MYRKTFAYFLKNFSVSSKVNLIKRRFILAIKKLQELIKVFMALSVLENFLYFCVQMCYIKTLRFSSLYLYRNVKTCYKKHLKLIYVK